MDLSKRSEAVEILSKLVSLLSDDEKQQLLRPIIKERKGIPISIFRSNLSGLEALAIYLKDIMGLSTRDVAELLNRNTSTIYTTYQNAKKKLKTELDCSDFSIEIPAAIFADRKFSVLESLAAHLREKENLTLARIAEAINRNYSTIKTVYRRYQEKKHDR